MINLFKLVSFIFLFLVSHSAIAQSTLSINESFNIISINGESHSKSLFSNNNVVKLVQGINKIALEYEAVFDTDDDDFNIIKSSPFVVSFYAPINRSFKLQFVKQLDSRAARKYAKDPLVSIESNGLLVRSNRIMLASDSRVFINQQTRLVTKQQPINILSSPIIAENRNTNRSYTPSPANMLSYWWDRASEDQRKAFLKSIEKNQ